MLVSPATDPILAGVVEACASGAAQQDEILPPLEHQSGRIDYVVAWE